MFPLRSALVVLISFVIGFKPGTESNYSGQFTVMNPAGGAIAQGSINGSGISGSGSSSTPGLTVSTASLAFGSVTVNTASTLPVTLTSTGTAPVTINSATLSGTGFTVSGATFPVTLNPTQSVTLNVRFDPTAAGAAAGQLTIQSNSSTNSTAVVSLSGTGTAVSGPQPPSPQLTISTTSLTFGDVTVNTASTQPVTLTSTGTVPVTVNSASLSGAGFTVSGATLPVTLNPNQALTLNVRFGPTVVGAATGQLTIQSNSSTDSTAVVESERHRDGSVESAVDDQRGQSDVRRCDSEHGIDAACDVDLNRDSAGDHQFGNTKWARIYGVGSHIPG